MPEQNTEYKELWHTFSKCRSRVVVLLHQAAASAVCYRDKNIY